MNHAVVNIATDSGALLHVSGELLSADRFRELTFMFANGTLFVRCDEDADEVLLDGSPNLAAARLLLFSGSLFDELLGMRIEYAWELRNHRGYTDGLQVRFIDENRREDCRQFEVSASGMDMRRVIP